jgi:hypothetical protein
VVSLKGDNLLVFYYLSASEIWPDQGVVFVGSGLIRVVHTTLSENRATDRNLTLRPNLVNFVIQCSTFYFASHFISNQFCIVLTMFILDKTIKSITCVKSQLWRIN